MASKVYFADARARKAEESLHIRAKKCLLEAGVEDKIDSGDFVAIKVHMGEKHGFRYLRPKMIRAVVELVREIGGKPFIVDNTCIGMLANRADALGYLEVARLNGYTWETLGAPILIGDGLLGLSGIKIPVNNGLRISEIELGQVLAEADAIISVAHFKGHPRTGIGGAIKNVAMGCLTKSGKAPMHLARKPWIKADKCNKCGKCVEFCPVDAIRLEDPPYIDENLCRWGCGCWSICPEKAISSWSEMHHPRNDELCIRLADSLKAIIDYFHGKICYLNYAVDITVHCDCADWSDQPLTPDLGALASLDPVALDKACMDLANKAQKISGGPASEITIEENMFRHVGEYEPLKWTESFGGGRPEALLEACQRLGLGSLEYTLIRV